jgi:hypothetical protein
MTLLISACLVARITSVKLWCQAPTTCGLWCACPWSSHRWGQYALVILLIQTKVFKKFKKKTHHLQNLGHESQEMLLGSWTETWDTRAVQQEATFYCPGTDSANSSPKAEPWEQRGLILYTLAGRLTHIWLHAILQATSLQCYVNFFTFRFSLSFMFLLCHPFPSLHYQNMVACFFSCLPPCYTTIV